MAPDGTDLMQMEDGTILINARTPIAKVNERMHTTLSTLAHNTIGGYALAQFGRLQTVGMAFEADGYRFAVRSVDDRSILSLAASPVS